MGYEKPKNMIRNINYLKKVVNNKTGNTDLSGRTPKAKNDLLDYEEIMYECTKDERNKDVKVSFKLPAKRIVIFRN